MHMSPVAVHWMLWMCVLCEKLAAPGTCVWSDVFHGPVETVLASLGYIAPCYAVAAPAPCPDCRLFTHGCINPMEAEQQVCNEVEMCKHFMVLNHITHCFWHTSAGCSDFLELHLFWSHLRMWLLFLKMQCGLIWMYYTSVLCIMSSLRGLCFNDWGFINVIEDIFMACKSFIPL